MLLQQDRLSIPVFVIRIGTQVALPPQFVLHAVRMVHTSPIYILIFQSSIFIRISSHSFASIVTPSIIIIMNGESHYNIIIVYDSG